MVVVPDTEAINRCINEYYYDLGVILRVDKGPNFFGDTHPFYSAGVPELAAVTGLNQRTIQRLRRGENNTTRIDTLDKLAVGLNVHVSRLVAS